MNNTINGQRVGVGLSGGVDSTAAAYYLLQEGYDVLGVTMYLDDASEACVAAGQAVARNLGIRHEVIDLRNEFRQLVKEPFVRSYACGLTPSPCVLCNSYFKFGALWDAMKALGCTAMATGHYAVIVERNGRYELHRGVDASKDQSYFLSQLTQEQLSRAILPLGRRYKADVSAEIRGLHARASEEGESQDLCFIPDGSIRNYIAAECPELVQDGHIVTQDGTVLGTHHGAFQYTRGQRKGLGLGGGPWFVIKVDVPANRVIVGHAEELSCHDLELTGVNWLIEPPADGVPFATRMQVRYLMKPRNAWVTPRAGGTSAHVRFVDPIPSAPPGQLAVAYDGNRVVVSGWIEA